MEVDYLPAPASPDPETFFYLGAQPSLRMRRLPPDVLCLERIFVCSVCDKYCDSPSRVKRHFMTHSGVRPFSCSQCFRSFQQGYHLKRHLLVHSAEKPFHCDVCWKSFARSDHFKLHSRRHAENFSFSFVPIDMDPS